VDLALETIVRPLMRSLRSNVNSKEEKKKKKEMKILGWDWADLIDSA